VATKNGQKLGNISELLLDLRAQRPTFVILSVEKIPGDLRTFAIALSGLSTETDQNLRTEATLQTFMRAPLLDDNAWQAVSSLAGDSSIIFRYADAQAASSKSSALETSGSGRNRELGLVQAPFRVNTPISLNH